MEEDNTKKRQRNKNMEFIVENVIQGARYGRLLFTTSSSTVLLETPSCLIHTRGGEVPNLTRDLEEQLLAQLLPTTNSNAIMVTMPSIYTISHDVSSADFLSQRNLGIHSYFHRESQPIYLSVQDPSSPAKYSYNEETSVSIWRRSGRAKVTVGDHMKLVRALKPDMFECLCDVAPSSGNKMKRMRKSVDRTLKFLDQTIEAVRNDENLQKCAIFAAVVGSDTIEERSRSARESALRPVDGFVLEGFDIEHSSEVLQDVLLSATSNLPQQKPRFIHGLRMPMDIIEAVEAGVDVFESSYSYSAAEIGRAVVFGRNGHEGSSADQLQFEIDLNNKKYEADLRPYLPGCPCYACTHHTRAYTHHLLATSEILGKILLMIHNLTHYLTFFADLRCALRTSETTYEEFKLRFNHHHKPCRHKQIV